MNFAGVHKLPVVFVCENNRYAYSTPLEKQMAIEDVADRAAAYGFKGHVCLGQRPARGARVERAPDRKDARRRAVRC